MITKKIFLSLFKSKEEKNLDDPQTTIEYAKLIQNKNFLYRLYLDFYQDIKNHLSILPKGKIVELGSGGGFMKKIIPVIITSDVIPLKNCDMQFSATNMPFPSRSITAFVMLDTFHHIKNPQKALREIYRCLRIGGKVVMIEPYNTMLCKFIYKNFHYEDFNIKAGWKINHKGHLSGANGALAWIVFERDRLNYQKLFPYLKINSITLHTPFRYIISGGLSSFQFLPNFMYSTIESLERVISPLNKMIAMFATIELEKIK